jgi:hypothetical protein
MVSSKVPNGHYCLILKTLNVVVCHWNIVGRERKRYIGVTWCIKKVIVTHLYIYIA